MAEMFTLTVAGHETSANTLTFLAYELARHPDYQERMREEIIARYKQVEGREGSELTIEDLESLTLTMNAIKVRAAVVTRSTCFYSLNDASNDSTKNMFAITIRSSRLQTLLPQHARFAMRS